MAIDKATFKEARNALIGGTKPVCAHFATSPEGEWVRVRAVRCESGNYYAKPINPTLDRFLLIDGLEVRR